MIFKWVPNTCQRSQTVGMYVQKLITVCFGIIMLFKPIIMFRPTGLTSLPYTYRYMWAIICELKLNGMNEWLSNLSFDAEITFCKLKLTVIEPIYPSRYFNINSVSRVNSILPPPPSLTLYASPLSPPLDQELSSSYCHLELFSHNFHILQFHVTDSLALWL